MGNAPGLGSMSFAKPYNPTYREQNPEQREQGVGNRRVDFSSSSSSSESSSEESYSWVKIRSSRCRRLEDQAIEAGYTRHGSPIWVGRANYNGALLPCKVLPRDNAAYTSYQGEVVETEYVEILCGDPESVAWLRKRNGAVSRLAIEGGRTSNGETLYIGRAYHRNSLIPGKIQPSHECLYVVYHGSEIDFEKYEILVAVE